MKKQGPGIGRGSCQFWVCQSVLLQFMLVRLEGGLQRKRLPVFVVRTTGGRSVNDKQANGQWYHMTMLLHSRLAQCKGSNLGKGAVMTNLAHRNCTRVTLQTSVTWKVWVKHEVYVPMA